MAILLLLGYLVLATILPGLTERIAADVATVANIKDAPYVVALSMPIYFRLLPYCTGTIIDPKWVLTAGHCILTSPESIGNIKIVAGTNTSIFPNSSEIQIRSAQKAFCHPKYWPKFTIVGRYDVAVIQVESFIFNAVVNKVNLWAKPWMRSSPEENVEYGTLNCTAYGWGALDVEGNKIERSEYLMKANVKAVHGTRACPFEQMFRQRRLICSLERALCPGDSGGPLVSNNTVVGIAHVIISKNGFSHLECNSDNIVSAWIYVCPMLDFIHKHVPSVPTKPESCSSSYLMPTVALIYLCYASYLAFHPTGTFE